MNWKDKNVLITGGAGFLGSHLVDGLLAKGATITVVDMLSLMEAKNLEHVKNQINYIQCDITKNKELEKINSNFDVIFHLAAYAVPRLCEENPEIAFRTNVLGTFNVLKFCLSKDVKKVIFTSSALLYGRYPKYLPIDEKHPIEVAESVYNATKKIGEDLFNLFYEKYGLPIVILRLFTTFGPRQSADYFFPTVILQTVKDGIVKIWNDKPTRDFTYVEDTVNALISAAEVKFCGGPINIGSGKEVKVGEIAEMIAQNFGSKAVSLNKEVVGSMRLQCDNTLAKNILKWEPRTSLEDGIKKTIEWFRNNLYLYT